MRTTTQYASLVMVLLLSGCGIDRGGIDDMDMTPVPPDDPVRPLVTVGVLERHESLPDAYYVGKGRATVIDATRNTTILVNGEPALPSDLQEGMYAHTYRGQTGPTTLTVNFNVAGGQPIENASTQRPSIFGIDVSTSDSELESAVADLTTNPTPEVAVSGYITADQGIDASAVLPYPANSMSLVTGFARDVDTASRTFNLGGHTIDYSQASVIDTESGSVEEFSRLRVTLDLSLLPGELRASSITQVHSLGPTPRFLDTDVFLDGYPTEVIDASQFRIGDVVFFTGSQTTFVNVQNNLVTTDALLSVYGLTDTDGRVFASRVERLN